MVRGLGGTPMADLASELSKYLTTDEKLVWSGRPARGIIFRAEDAYFLPFGLFWLAFIVFVAIAVLNNGQAQGPGGLVFLLPFIAVGLYLVPVRFLWDADIRANTVYALTNRRAIIFRRVPSRRFRGLGLTQATEIVTVERTDGSGTIT